MQTRQGLATVRTRVVSTLARGQIAGPTVADAVRVGGMEAAAGALLTLGPWSASSDAPGCVARRYHDALGAIDDAGLPATLSIKVPDLAFDEALLAAVVSDAAARHLALHLDSLRPGTEDRTLRLVPHLLAVHPDLGVTLPGRWARSVRDAATLVELGLRSVRVVKGQWEDPADPRRDPARGVLDVVEALRGSGAVVGVATHDARLALAALDRLLAAETECRVEQLYGLPRLDLAQLHARFGVGHLIYVPFGEAYLPYALSQALRHPRVLTWIARDLARSRAAARSS